MNEKYKDILLMEYTGIQSRQPMPLHHRAAQFAPFAALTGYEDAIKEAMRKTEQKKELLESELSNLNEKLQSIPLLSQIKVTFFQEDEIKEGGCYQTLVTCIRKIDHDRKVLVLENHVEIAFEDLKEIEILEKGN